MLVFAKGAGTSVCCSSSTPFMHTCVALSEVAGGGCACGCFVVAAQQLHDAQRDLVGVARHWQVLVMENNWLIFSNGKNVLRNSAMQVAKCGIDGRNFLILTLQTLPDGTEIYAQTAS